MKISTWSRSLPARAGVGKSRKYALVKGRAEDQGVSECCDSCRAKPEVSNTPAEQDNKIRWKNAVRFGVGSALLATGGAFLGDPQSYPGLVDLVKVLPGTVMLSAIGAGLGAHWASEDFIFYGDQTEVEAYKRFQKKVERAGNFGALIGGSVPVSTMVGALFGYPAIPVVAAVGAVLGCLVDPLPKRPGPLSDL